MTDDQTAGGTGATDDDNKPQLTEADVAKRVTEAVAEATKRANREAQAERQKRQSWEKLGKTPEEMQELLDAHAALEEKKQREAGQFDAVKAQINDTWSKKYKATEDERDAARSELTTYRIESEATAAIASAKGSTKLLLPVLRQYLKVQDGKVRVVDATGEQKLGSSGDPMTVSEFVNELRASEDFGRAFDGSGHSGSGTAPASGGGANSSRNIKTKADVEAAAKGDKIAARRLRVEFIDKNGIETYNSLPNS